MTVTLLRGDALALPLADDSVDLVVTSPPYFALRSYTDGGEHYAGQIGSEPTPGEFLDALLAATREAVRVLKPTGSLWVNLGDKYARPGGGVDIGQRNRRLDRAGRGSSRRLPTPPEACGGIPEKSLMGLPWRYAIRCIDELGLILRAEVVWSKPNGLPESVTDRVRRSHETWFHFTLQPRYYAAVDAIREPLRDTSEHAARRRERGDARLDLAGGGRTSAAHPLGKLPGSVWEIPTQPLTVPAELGVDHFAAFPMEWPRRIITGWSPAGVCTACGEGRRPVMTSEYVKVWNHEPKRTAANPDNTLESFSAKGRGYNVRALVGEVCACPDTTAPTTPAVVLDPFGGTGTTALVASVLGRHGISVDMSADYCRLAAWRTSDPAQRARALRGRRPAKRRPTRVRPATAAPAALFEMPGGGAA